MHSIDYIWMPYPTNINQSDIVEVTISPQGGELYATKYPRLFSHRWIMG